MARVGRRPKKSTSKHGGDGSLVRLTATISRDPRQILIVDDDHDLRESLRAILEEEGFATCGAANGQEAIELLRRGGLPRPSVILVDLMMPVMTGFDLIERLGREPGLATIPVVCMTAFRTLVNGNIRSRVLFKPFSIEGVLSAIHRAS